MNAKQFFDAGHGTRKAASWAEIQPAAVDTEGLPRFAAAELYALPGKAAPTTSFAVPTPQFFIICFAGGNYLVDTQGYDYARCTARIA